MTTQITHCDLCEKVVAGPRIKRTVNGMAITCGFSIGGWGRRENYVAFSGEVCEECFREYKKIAGAIAAWLSQRDGCRAPTITVTEHDVSIVRNDEPSPRRRETAILR
jgi:hypothetical protein